MRNLKIRKLWQYLRIQDNELLIVQVYNPKKETDEYLVAEKRDNKLTVSVMDSFMQYVGHKPFRLIQQRDSSKRHVTPSVKQIENEKEKDY